MRWHGANAACSVVAQLTVAVPCCMRRRSGESQSTPCVHSPILPPLRAATRPMPRQGAGAQTLAMHELQCPSAGPRCMSYALLLRLGLPEC